MSIETTRVVGGAVIGGVVWYRAHDTLHYATFADGLEWCLSVRLDDDGEIRTWVITGREGDEIVVEPRELGSYRRPGNARRAAERAIAEFVAAEWSWILGKGPCPYAGIRAA